MDTGVGMGTTAMPEKIRVRCYVCMLEDGMKNIFRRVEGLSELAEILGTSEDSVKRKKGLVSTRNLACCSSDDCSLFSHSACVNSNNFIFKHTELQGLNVSRLLIIPLQKDCRFQTLK
jgi:hypothetical protein